MVLVLAIAFAVHATGQVITVQQAFADSYTSEYAGKYSEAVGKLMAVYKEDNYEINLRLGWLHYLNANYNESIAYYQKSAKLMPASVESSWGIINPLSKLEKWQEVENAYLRILSIDKNNASAHYRLGVIYYYRKDYVKAKKYLDVSLNQYPFDYDSNLMSAWNAYFLGYTNQAKLLFNRVLLIKPEDSSAKEGLSLIK